MVSGCARVAYSVRIACKTVVATVSIVLIRYNRRVYTKCERNADKWVDRGHNGDRCTVYVYSKDAGKLFNKNKLKWYTHIHCAHLTHGSAQPSPRPVQLGPLFSVMHTNVNTIVWPIHHSKKSQRKVFFSLLCFPFFLSSLSVVIVCIVRMLRAN